ncbi:MAG: VOC family protein [Candidatus Poribacteria bacterium]|nr:VOC family protein [Candidatus Poribacteria bacterium]
MSGTLVHVGVRTTNLEQSIRFWRDALGLKLASQMDGCYDLTDGYHNFRVFQHNGPSRPSHVGGMLDYLHIGVRVPDLQEAAQRCDALGFQIIWDGVDGGKAYDPSSPPSESFKVEDPDGIVVDVTASDDQWPGVQLRGRDGG